MSCFPRRRRSLPPAATPLLLMIGSLLLLACPKRSFDLDVGGFNERKRQQQAVILLSDPQIYSREALVDDRRKEVEFLRTLLEKSKDETFEPEIRRQLRLMTSLVAELGVKFDPLAGAAAAGGAELGGLRREIEAARLQAELLSVRRDLEALRGAAGARTAEVRDTASAANAEPFSSPGLGQAEKVEEKLKALADRLQTLADEKLEATAATQTPASPRDTFRDLQTYRGEIRAAIDAVNLDDVHDEEGNALYRLHFRAALAPGYHKDQLGVARVTVKPPQLDWPDVDDLYLKWLAHLNFRVGMGEDEAYVNTVSIGSPIIAIVELRLGLEPVDDAYCLQPRAEASPRCATLKLVVPRERREKIRDLLEPKGLETLRLLEYEPRIGSVEKIRATCSELPEALEAADNLRLLTAALHGHIQRFSHDGSKEMLEALRRRTALIAPSALFPYHDDDVVAQEDACAARVPGYQRYQRWAPWAFASRLVTYERCNADDGNEAYEEYQIAGILGNAYGYAATPVELAQRISTVSSAADAVQVAAALSAIVPGQGVGIDAGLGRMGLAAGQAEALERTPLIVGFSDRLTGTSGALEAAALVKRLQESQRSVTNVELPDSLCHARVPVGHPPRPTDAAYRANQRRLLSDSLPRFGWVFGPRAYFEHRRNGSNLAMRQVVINHQVAADLSLPAWWPWVELEVETAWVGSWREGCCGAQVDILASDHPERRRFQAIKVPLPFNRADRDALTNRVLGAQVRMTRVDGVDPEAIAACSGEATFLVRGRDVWRSSQAFLGGLDAKQIRVLPDMEGVAVTFDMNRLPRPQASEELALTVWTQHGADSHPVTVKGAMEPKACGTS